MAAVIRLNEEGLLSASTQLKQQGDELESLISSIGSVIDGLPESWEGEAAVAYGEQFRELKPGLDSARVLIEDIAKQIDDTLKAVQELDLNVANQLRK